MGEQQVDDDLNVESPVARVVEDEDGGDFERAGEFVGDGAGVGGVVGVVGEGPEGGVGGY